MTTDRDRERGQWIGTVAAGAAAVVLAGYGCAHQKGASNPASKKTEKSKTEKEVEQLKSRIEELERTNGRLSVRVDEMEDDLFLLQDRVQANRLSLKRQENRQSQPGGGREGKRRAEAPNPEPSTHYNGRRKDEGSQHPVTRIPLSPEQSGSGTQRRSRANRRGGSESNESQAGDRPRESGGAESREVRRSNSDPGRPRARGDQQGEPDSEIVVTEKDFQKFARNVESGEGEKDGFSESDSEQGGASKDKAAKRPQKEVTDEKIEAEGANSAAGPKPESKKDTSSESASTDSLSEKSGLDLYKAALGKYRSGDFATALRGFEKFMDGNPRRDYRDNGLYWVGECHFGLGDYKEAIGYFQRVLDEYPGGNKVPDAMLKMSLGYRELGQTEKARNLLEKLTQRYPTTNAGQLGEKKLSKFES